MWRAGPGSWQMAPGLLGMLLGALAVPAAVPTVQQLREILEACKGWDSGHGMQPEYHEHPGEVVSGVPWGMGGIVFLNAPWPKAGLELLVWLLGSGSPRGSPSAARVCGCWTMTGAAVLPGTGPTSVPPTLLAVSKRPPCPLRGTGSPWLAGPPCPVFLHHLSACAEPVNHAVGGREMGWGLGVLLGLGTCRAEQGDRDPPGDEGGVGRALLSSFISPHEGPRPSSVAPAQVQTPTKGHLQAVPGAKLGQMGRPSV